MAVTQKGVLLHDAILLLYQPLVGIFVTMLFVSTIALLLFALGRAHSSDQEYHYGDQGVLSSPELTINGIPFTTRAHWMRRANQALVELVSPCPFAAFGTAIVNHTGSESLGDLICIGVNENAQTGNLIMHGEMAAISNCTKVLTDPKGPYRLTASEARAAFPSFTLYTNAESCPMCASAIRWAGFKEYVYGTSIDTLIEQGFGQIRISSQEVLHQSYDLRYASRLIGNLLANETDPYFAWQYNPAAPCPVGCRRAIDRGWCTEKK